jgi:hypothetical protein
MDHNNQESNLAALYAKQRNPRNTTIAYLKVPGTSRRAKLAAAVETGFISEGCAENILVFKEALYGSPTWSKPSSISGATFWGKHWMIRGTM